MKIIEKNVEIPVLDGTSVPGVITEPQQLSIRATAVLAHGIFSNKDENGRFIRQAAMLSEKGIRTIRFDFRGHGDHKLPSFSTSIIGMLLDFATVMEFASSSYEQPLLLVASSFGGSIALLYFQTDDYYRPKKILLLNPVVEYRTTFVEPLGPDMKANFSPAYWAEWKKNGNMNPTPEFRLNRIFGFELMTLRPYLTFKQLNIPTRIIHGSADRSVSYEVVQTYSAKSKVVDFQLVEGADHAFDLPWEEKITFESIAAWFENIP